MEVVIEGVLAVQAGSNPRVVAQRLRSLLSELIDRLSDLESESVPPQTITVAFHPAFEQGEAD